MTYRDFLPAALEGDPRAVTRLLASFRPFVTTYCRARLGSRVGADDVAREACMAVLSALPGYPDQGRPFLAFVYDIVAAKVADATGAPPGKLERLLDTLSGTQRDIVLLRAVVGLSAEETGEAVGMTPGAVRLAQHRALQRLRTAMGPGSAE
jgi:RNA polymerase sigma-70 factor (ECF subfamily)